MSEALATQNELDRIPNLHEAIAGSRHVFLEVGTGVNPVPIERATLVGLGGIYIGWNIDSRQHYRLWFEELRMGSRPHCWAVYQPLGPANYRSSLSDNIGIESVIPPSSIDEIFIGNIVGEPHSIYNFPKNKILNRSGNEYRGSTPGYRKEQLLRSVYDILKPGGIITVLETETPSFQTDGRPSGEALVEQLGYGAVSVVSYYDDDFGSMLAQYSTRSRTEVSKNSYFVRALKLN